VVPHLENTGFTSKVDLPEVGGKDIGLGDRFIPLLFGLQESDPVHRALSLKVIELVKKIGYNRIKCLGALIMSDERIERILKNTKFTMEMEGFTIDKELEDVGRKILTGEVKRSDFIESIKEKYRGYAHEV